MSQRMILNETSYFGAGAIADIVNEVKQRRFVKALVVTDKELVKHNVVSKITGLLDLHQLPYSVFDETVANPTIEVVQQGLAAIKAAGADYIIAIGGGSPMDTAKAIGIISNNPEYADVRSLEGAVATAHKSVPIIAVPTTAGTAAEVTINYVITDTQNKRKFVCVDPHDIPVVAIVDPDMMKLHAQRTHRRHRHGRFNPCDRRVHYQSSLGVDRCAASKSGGNHRPLPARRREQ